MFIRNNKKGFTLIELIVVIAIIGILGLLATPKYLNHRKETKLAQIKNDVKVVESVLYEYRVENSKLPPYSVSEIDYSIPLSENRIYGKNGLVTNLSGEFLDISNMKEVKSVNSKLKGKFIANNNGDVYFIADKSIGIGSEDIEEEPDSISISMAFGEYYTLILKDNKVYGVGYNEEGQLGLGDYENRLVFTEIEELRDKEIVKIIAGYYSTYAISRNGDVYVWGPNYSGELAVGDDEPRITPGKSNILSNFASKDIKNNSRHCLLLEDGKVYAWGYNYFGQLGLNDSYYSLETPTEISYFTNNNINVKDVFPWNSSSFATTTNNRLYSWGYNYYGQLGLGDFFHRLLPTEVTFFRGIPIKDIQAGWSTTFVLTENGKLYGFGRNDSGQLGLGHNEKNVPYPQLINVDGKVVKEISVGSGGSVMAITQDGYIYGWGYNDYGELGLPNKSHNTPVRLTHIEELNPAKIKISSDGSTFIVTKTGDIYVWGYNEDGQLGLGHTNNVTVPTKLDLSFLND